MEGNLTGKYTINDVGFAIKEISELLAGDILLHPIYREDGLMLVNRYTPLTEGALRQIGIHLRENTPVATAVDPKDFTAFLIKKIYDNENFIALLEDILIKSEGNYKVPITLESYMDERVDYRAIRKIPNELVPVVDPPEKSILGRYIEATPLWEAFENRLESPALQDRAKHIKEILLEKMNLDDEIMGLIVRMSDYDKIFLIRSMNALCIALLIGLTLELSDEDLVNLSFTALFCNIGFVEMDKDSFHTYIDSTENLNMIHKHIKSSIEIISASTFCRNKTMLMGIMEHHELYNGKGYPIGKSGKSISIFGRIIGIVLEYDDLVSGSFGRDGISSNKAEDIMWGDKEGKYDKEILRILLDRSNILKNGQPYINENKEKGVIIGFPNFLEEPAKPIVRFQNYTLDYLLDEML